MSSSSYAQSSQVFWLCVSPALCSFLQVQCCVQVPVERSSSAVSTTALLGSPDAEETLEIHPDGRREVETTQPHGLPD